MKKVYLTFFVVLFVFVLVSCPIDTSENTVTIRGTVTITRNGVPWNSNNFPQNEIYMEEDFITNRPIVIAYTTNRENYNDSIDAILNPQVYIGYNHAHQKQDVNDMDKGTYKWDIRIPSNELPCMIYFEVGCWMEYAPFQGRKRTEGIWVTKENTGINLGHFNYNVIQVSGNFPVSINGDSLSIETKDWAEMYVTHRYGTELYPYETVWIYPNGDWSFNVVEQGWPMPLRFYVLAGRENGFFKLELTGDENTVDELIWVHDADKQITFPDHQSIDFQAVTLSGTLKLNIPKGRDLLCRLYFYDEEVDYYASWWNLIGREEIHLQNIQYEGDGLIIEWNVIVPASFPKDLPFYLFASTPDGEKFETYSVLKTTDSTDLKNIFIGHFTIEEPVINFV
jgi:hypothetical protein